MTIKSRFAVAVIAALAAFGTVAQAQARGPHGGPWEMAGAGPEGGPGGGRDCGCCQREKPLTESQVQDIVKGMIAWRGEEASLGKVKTLEGDKIAAEILDKDGKLLRTITFDAKTGRPLRPVKPPVE